MRITLREHPQFLVAAVLLLLVLAVYGQVGGHAFINLDDYQYVTKNPHVLRGLTPEGITWAFTTFEVGNWHPLTWLSHMVDVELFGLSPGWHHVVNLLLHLLNTELLFLLLWRMTGGLWQSAFVAALFAIHPLHVESVAWVAERKDLLGGLFFLLTIAAWSRYAKKPGLGRYLAVGAAFALGLMCKPMLVTLPFVLLLLDYWPLARFPGLTPLRLACEKGPLLAMSAASGVLTFLAQSGAGFVGSLDYMPFGLRLSNALVSYAKYLGKFAWPSHLAVFYPHPASLHAGIPVLEVVGAALLIAGISILALRQIHSYPCLAVGWFWYLGTLVPVIGLVQVGSHALADRYTYIPSIGIFIALAWGLPESIRTWRYRRSILGTAAIVWIAILSSVAWVQAGYWRGSIPLFTRTLEVTDNNWFAMNNLGAGYDEIGEPRKAIELLRAVLRMRPTDALVMKNLGLSYERLGQPEKAAATYESLVRIRPDDADSRVSLGLAYEKAGLHMQAIGSITEALRLRPEFPEALNALGIVYNGQGQFRTAIECYRRAIKARSDFAEGWNNLAGAMDRVGQSRESIAYYREAIRLRPDYADAWRNVGLAYGRMGMYPEAIACFRESVRIKPDFAGAWNNLGTVYEKSGKREEADASFREARRIGLR